MFIASVMRYSHLILWCPFLLLPLIFPSIRNFSNESSVHIKWPKYCSFSFRTSSEYLGLTYYISLRLTDYISLLSKGLSGVFSSTSVQRHQFFGILPSLQPSSHNDWVLIMKKLPVCDHWEDHAAAAAKSLQSCPTLCDPIDGSPQAFTIWTTVSRVTSLLLNTLSRLVIPECSFWKEWC